MRYRRGYKQDGPHASRPGEAAVLENRKEPVLVWVGLDLEPVGHDPPVFTCSTLASIISPAFLGLAAPTLVSSMKCLTQIVADAISGTMFGATPPSVTTPWNRN
ncbi:MAG: hypothetical protein AB1563_05920 [Bacillota bacterium]